MKEPIQVTVIGGSACSSAGLNNSFEAWPQVAFSDTAKFQLNSKSLGGLTFVRSVEILFSMVPTSFLVLHFGTSIGWPSLLVQMQDKFGIKFSSEFGFHQPIISERSKTISFKLRKMVKLRFKNGIKYLFLLLGLYRPKVSIHEIRDQIDAVVSIATVKADSVLWIQHRALQDIHTLAERFFYRRYYSRVLAKLKSIDKPKLNIVEIPDSFLTRENYLSDGVHLSALGHYELAKLVIGQLTKTRI